MKVVKIESIIGVCRDKAGLNVRDYICENKLSILQYVWRCVL